MGIVSPVIHRARDRSISLSHLNITRLIPEELVPLKVIGRITLNRWPNNFFDETEQVAIFPSHVVSDIDFSNDHLLQVSLFSYLDKIGRAHV